MSFGKIRGGDSGLGPELFEGGERREERLANAERFFKNFIGIRPDEKVLFLSHIDRESSDPRLIQILKDALSREGISYTEIVADASTNTKDVVKLLKDYSVVWSSCDWDTTGIDFYKLTAALEEKEARMSDAAGLTAESFGNDGLLGESLEVLYERLNRMEAKLKETVGFRIQTSYGTDLIVGLKPDQARRWASVTGEIDTGEWDNPGAEIFTTPDENGVNGVLMLPVLQDEITREQGVDELVRVVFKNGRITTIDGDKSAEKLRRYLEEMSKREDESNIMSVLRCAELAFGASKYARSKVANPGMSYTHHGVSVLEAEKRMGTMHIAIGSSQHGIEGASGVTESNIHIDFVIPRNGLTVEAFYNRNDFRERSNGRKLISDGGWNFV